MRCFIAIASVCLLIVLAPVVDLQAQGETGEFVSESSAGSAFGVGGRAVGMSEAVIVSVKDGFAIVYNPAALVKIKRPEFLGALSYEKLNNETAAGTPFEGVSVANNDLSKTRLSSLTLSVPVPTYRGSFVLAFGVNRTHSFDNTFTMYSMVPNSSSRGLEEVGGSIREYAGAAAIELSPRLAVGITLIYFRGGEDYFWNFRGDFTAPTETLEYIDNIKSDYSGVGARLGSRFELNRNFALGFTLDTPVKYKIEQDYVFTTIENGDTDIDQGAYEYHLTHPLSMSGGASFQTRTFVIEVDVRYTDWSQLKYDFDDDPFLLQDNLSLQRSYDDALSVMVGAEYIIPQYDLVLRGGFKHDPLPFSNAFAVNQIEQDRNSFSFGFSYLIDRVAMLDIGYARASYELVDAVSQLVQKYTSDKVMVSVGYRI